ncbi:MAG: hypothetical protein V7K47_07500 [Nostoc sp.]
MTRVKGRKPELLDTEIKFYKTELLPYFIKLSQHNPVFNITEQLRLLVGVWTPIWSTISFHETLPKRIQEQSFQIFQQNGYCASVARYILGKESFSYRESPLKLLAYDFMVVQKYEVKNGKWYIQDVGKFQAFKNPEIPLTLESASDWFTNVFNTQVKSSVLKVNLPKALELDNLDTNNAAQNQKTCLATSLVFEHLYIDSDWRLVKTQTDASQLPNYTIAVKR